MADALSFGEDAEKSLLLQCVLLATRRSDHAAPRHHD